MQSLTIEFPTDCDLPDGWTLNKVLLRILEYVSHRLTGQEGYYYRLRSCIVHTRCEACYLGWWEDNRLAFCRDLDVGRYGAFSVPADLQRTLLIEIPTATELASIRLPMVCEYSVMAHCLCGRSAEMELRADGTVREWTRWMS
jgi:hypothetical protein